MKKIISLIVSVVFLLNCTVIGVNASTAEVASVEEDADIRVEDSFSKAILKSGLYEKDKIQKCENLSGGISATAQLVENNSQKMNNSIDELFVENCVIVKSVQEIVFDTSNVISAVRYDDIYYIQYETVEMAKEAVGILEQYPSVEYAATDSVVSMEMTPIIVAEAASPLRGKDGYTHHSWGITQTGLDILAEYVSNRTSESIDIAVIDSGVYSSHPFLQGHISSTQYDLVGQDSIADDPRGHGTLVTGIIVDAMQKLDFNIIPIRVFDGNGNSTISRIAQGIDQAVRAGADVINLSLSVDAYSDHSSIDSAINSAIANNIIVVAAAGNDNKSTATRCPAHSSAPIVVSGIDKEKTRYSKSNFGDSVDVTGSAVKVKSCAIPASSTTGYGIASGTSLAAPHITAAAAMLRMLYPTFSATSIQNLIRTYTVDVGDAGFDVYFGNGFSKISNRVVTVPFADVSSGDYYYDGVYSGYGRGYMTGKNNTIFAPTENMQRQDVVSMYYRMAGEPYVVYRNIYSDVSSSDYFAKAAVWAYNKGIMTGRADGSLGVGESITREDFSVSLVRYANYRDMSTNSNQSLSDYLDSNLVSEYALPYVRWAVEQKLMGQGGNRLRPQEYINRADISVMIYRFLCL